MRLRLCILSAFPQQFVKFCERTLSMMTARGSVDLFVCGNGWTAAEVSTAYILIQQPPFDEKISVDMIWNRSTNDGMQQGLQSLYEKVREDVALRPTPGNDDIIAFLHDDLYVHEQGWDMRVLKAFVDHPKVGLVGFGGATALGGDEIYKDPYEFAQLGRRNFYSNMRGAEIHGERTTIEQPIVFTDGFSLIVRRSLLDKIDGWSWLPPEMVAYGYDCGMACMAKRHGYEGWLVPVDIEHGDPKGWGGRTRETSLHLDMAKRYGGDDHVHTNVHRFLYDTFRDVLPLRLP